MKEHRKSPSFPGRGEPQARGYHLFARYFLATAPDGLIERVGAAEHEADIAAALEPLHAKLGDANGIVGVQPHANADGEPGLACRAGNPGDALEDSRMAHL